MMGRKPLAAAAVLLSVALLGAGVALAGTGNTGSGKTTTTSGCGQATTCTTTTATTPGVTTTTPGSVTQTPRRTTPATPRRKTKPAHHRVGPFAPDTLRGAPEVSGVILDATTHQFKQVVFDRGRVTAVTSTTITIRQQQAGVLWRTQTFDVPSSAKITVENKAVAGLTSIAVGSVARIESSGAVGGSLAVVRINALQRGLPAMPTTNG
jgi:hypothetical protein